MQRTEDGGIVISCDFCGTDWDEVIPMIEGHHGSTLCLDCLQAALDQTQPAAQAFPCTLCLRDLPADTARWQPSPLPPSANPSAAACGECLSQAAGTFSKDPDVDWKNPLKKPE